MARRTGGHQSQVDEARRKKQGNTNRNLLAFFLFAVAVAIASYVGYLVLMGSEGKTHFVVFYVPKYSETGDTSSTNGQLYLRDLYVERDVALIKASLPEGDSILFHEPIKVTSDESSVVNQLEKLVSDTRIGEKDNLIFYVAMRGVVPLGTSGGTHTASLQNSTIKRVSESVEEVLVRANQIKCASQLFLFETPGTNVSVVDVMAEKNGSLTIPEYESYPHFQLQALKSAVAGQTGDKQVWAIVSHRLFEASHYLHSLENSVFAEALSVSLLNARKKKEKLSIRTLFADLREHSLHLTSDREENFAQQPLLVDCSRGVHVASRAVLDGENLNDIIAFSNTSVLGVGEAEKTSTATVEDDDPVAAEAERKNRESFTTFWGLVSSLEDRTETMPHTPIDFAPAEWARLLDETIDAHIRNQCNGKGRVPNSVLNELKVLNDVMDLGRFNDDAEAISLHDFASELDVVRSIQVQPIANKFVAYVGEWSAKNKLANSANLQFSFESLIRKTIRLGNLRDELFSSRFYLLGFDADPVSFDRGKLVKRLGRWRDDANWVAFTDESLFINENLTLIGTGDFDVPVPENVALQVADSPYFYEQQVRSYLILKYLSRDTTFQFPAPEFSNDSHRSVQDFDAANDKKFTQNLGNKMALLTELGVTVEVPFANNNGFSNIVNYPIFAHQTANLPITSMYSELSHRMAIAGFRSHLGAYDAKPIRIIWDVKQERISIAMGPNYSGLNPVDSKSNPTTLQLSSEGDAATIHVYATLELDSKIVWKKSDNAFSKFIEITNGPQTTLEDGRREFQIKLEPKLNQEQFLASSDNSGQTSIPLSIRAVTISDQSVSAEIQFNIVLPRPDKFKLRVSNGKIQPGRNSVTGNFAASTNEAKANRITIKPLTTLQTPFVFEVFNSADVERQISLTVYVLNTKTQQTSKIRGRLPDYEISGLQRMLRNSDLRRLLINANDNPLKPGWNTIELKPIFKDIPVIEGPLLAVLQDNRKKWMQWIELDRFTAGQMVQKTGFGDNRLEFGINEDLKDLNPDDFEFRASLASGARQTAYESDAFSITWPAGTGRRNSRIFVDLLGEPRAIKYAFTGANEPVPAQGERYFAFDFLARDELRKKMQVYKAIDERTGIDTWYFMFKEPLTSAQRRKHRAVLNLESPGDRWSMQQFGWHPKEVDRDVTYRMEFAEKEVVLWAEARDFTWEITDGDRRYELEIGGRSVAAMDILTSAPREMQARVVVDTGGIKKVAYGETESIEIGLRFETYLPSNTFSLTIGDGKEDVQIFEDEPVPENGRLSVQRHLFRKIFKNDSAEDKSFVITARVKDYFGAVASDFREIAIQGKPKDSDKTVEEMKTYRDHIVNVTGKRIYSATLDGIPLPEPGGVIQINRRKVKVRIRDEKQIKLLGLPDGEYSLEIEFRDGAGTGDETFALIANKEKTETAIEIE